MQAIRTIGLDIAKSVFQVHGVDAQGNLMLRRQLKRRYVLPFFQKLPPCLIVIEACATSHYWSRELQALGHKVRLPHAPATWSPAKRSPFRTDAYFTRFHPTSPVPPIDAATDHLRSSPAKVMMVRFCSVPAQFG
jgi:transposase